MPLLVLVETYVLGRNMVEVKPLKKCLMHVQSDNFNLFFLKVYSDGFEVNSVIVEVPYEVQKCWTKILDLNLTRF